MKGKRVKLIRKSPVGVQRKHYAAKEDIAMEYDHRRPFGDFGGGVRRSGGRQSNFTKLLKSSKVNKTIDY